MISGLHQQPTPQEQHSISQCPQTQQLPIPQLTLAVPTEHCGQQPPLLVLQHTSATSHVGQAATPCPPAAFGHPVPCRQKSQLLLPTWRSALSFWLGKKASFFWCPSSLMRKAWAQSTPCFMGLGSPALAGRPAAGLPPLPLGEVVFPMAFVEGM